MFISKVELNNFRKFEDFKIDFLPQGDSTPKVSVLIGSNGSGKTTILEAIEYLLQRFTQRVIGENFSNPFEWTDLRRYKGKVCDESTIGIEIDLSNYHLSGGNNFSWKLPVNKFDKVTREKLSKASLQEVDRLISEILPDATNELDVKNLPSIMSYRVDRSSIVIPRRNRGRGISSPIDYYRNVFGRQVDFRNFFEWFEDVENLENQYKVNKARGFQYDSNQKFEISIKQIKAVRESIESFMDGFTGLHVDRTPPKTINISKEGEWLTINHLSHGEKILLALVGDIAKNLVLCNPDSEKPLEGFGIVLIDEIDLHLHPRWQMDILDKLSSQFKNCQFIVTTHSPLVITTANNVNVFNFDELKHVHKIEPQSFYGWSANNMYNQMGAIFMERDLYGKLENISEKLDNSEKNSSDINELSEMFEQLMESNPAAKNEKIDEVRNKINLESSLAEKDRIFTENTFKQIFGD